MSDFTATPDRVLVALSGGVDSAICVKILQEQGFAVEAVVISFSPAHNKAVAAAQVAAQELGIPLEVRHCEAQFEQHVIHPFCTAYASGQTPNPCILCNPNVKFKGLVAHANERGIHYIASGHYARIVERNGVFHVAQAASKSRDQSYMLYRLGQDVLSRLCLPIGEFEKTDVRAMAQSYNLTSAASPDSQEICFIPNGDYAAYIQEKGIVGKQGHMIDPDGKDLGRHKGVLHYTVGQRRGIGVALGKPVFVKSILDDGNIQLAWSGQEFFHSIALSNVVSTNAKPLQNGDTYSIKIRSMAKPVPCRIQIGESGSVTILFDEPQRAPAPGQSAVLYHEELVMGGGTITHAIE